MKLNVKESDLGPDGKFSATRDCGRPQFLLLSGVDHVLGKAVSFNQALPDILLVVSMTYIYTLARKPKQNNS
jgi:hypothetical protein